MQVVFERGDEIGREQRTLPADYYRLLHLLFSRSSDKALFVPIRTMQYLSIVDSEEVVFIDGQGPRRIELAWRDFHPGERDDLRAPVGYTCVYYEDKGRRVLPRLQGEFLKALRLMAARQPKASAATVTPLPRGPGKSS